MDATPVDMLMIAALLMERGDDCWLAAAAFSNGWKA